MGNHGINVHREKTLYFPKLDGNVIHKLFSDQKPKTKIKELQEFQSFIMYLRTILATRPSSFYPKKTSRLGLNHLIPNQRLGMSGKNKNTANSIIPQVKKGVGGIKLSWSELRKLKLALNTSELFTTFKAFKIPYQNNLIFVCKLLHDLN